MFCGKGPCPPFGELSPELAELTPPVAILIRGLLAFVPRLPHSGTIL